MGKCVSKESLNNIERGIDHIRDTIYPEDDQLRSIDITHVPDVILYQKQTRARVIDVYDGDTITVIFLLGNVPVQMKIRLKGIDTPEVRAGKGKLKAEKIAGKVCRDYLRSLVGNKIVTLIISDWDKYGGRVIGDIYFDGENVSYYMMKNGYAKSYDGGKKHKWTEQELILIIDKIKN